MTAETGTIAIMPQALAYTWGADGSLVPSVPMPAQGGAPAVFAGAGSPWQSFSINQVTEPCAMYYEVLLTASLWSPDGRYVVPMLYAHGLLATAPVSAPTATPQDGGDGTNPCSSPGGSSSAGQLAPLQAPAAAAAAIDQLVSPSNTYAVSVRGLLSPAGSRLAVQPQGMPYAPWIAQVYDTAAGTPRATITTEKLGLHTALRSALDFNLAWSPDGAHLLLANSQAFYLLGARSLGG